MEYLIGVLTGILLTGIVFVFWYRRNKRKTQIALDQATQLADRISQEVKKVTRGKKPVSRSR